MCVSSCGTIYVRDSKWLLVRSYLKAMYCADCSCSREEVEERLGRTGRSLQAPSSLRSLFNKHCFILISRRGTPLKPVLPPRAEILADSIHLHRGAVRLEWQRADLQDERSPEVYSSARIMIYFKLLKPNNTFQKNTQRIRDIVSENSERIPNVNLYIKQ